LHLQLRTLMTMSEILHILRQNHPEIMYIRYGNSQRVMAIRNPFGLLGSDWGIASSLGRVLPSSSIQQNPFTPSNDLASVFFIPNVIETDAAINPWNSDVPLLNMKGEVVGIYTVIFSNIGLYTRVDFAVPSNTIEKVIPHQLAKEPMNISILE
jgi:S1-C subfamily serine protease